MRLGFAVVIVPGQQWHELPENSEARVKYLKKRIAEVVVIKRGGMRRQSA